MKIQVNNVTGVQRAEFTLAAPITLIAGLNAAGKSSLLKAIGRTLSGSPLPGSVLKKDAAVMLKAGAKAGDVVITTDEGQVRSDYPKAEYTLVTGVAPRVKAIAAGLVDFSDLKPEDRTLALISAMKAGCDEDDVKRELAKAGADDKKIKSVVGFLGFDKGREIAWDSTADMYAKQATQGKGAWKAATGVNWGAAIANGWRPDGFTEDLVEASMDALKQAVEDAKKARDIAVAANGLDDETTQRLRALIETEKERDDAVEAATKAFQAAELVVQTAQAHRDQLPTASDTGNATCPCCNERLRIHRLDLSGTEFQISKVEPIPAQERSDRLSNIAKADGDLANAKDKRMAANSALVKAQADLKQVYDAQDRLKAAEEAKAQAGLATSALSVETCDAALEEAQNRLKLADTYRKATTTQAEIALNLAIAEILGPKGVRHTKLLGHLDILNKQILRPITAPFDLPDVAITEEVAITLNGRPFEFCSESEQWLANTVLRLAIAKMQNAPVVIVDGVDILDMERKNNLFSAIEAVGVPCLLGATIPAGVTKCWDFAADQPPLGQSFWMESGVLKPLAQALPMKAAA